MNKVEIRRVLQKDLALVADLDYEAIFPSGTEEEADTFQQRFQVFPSGFIVLTEQDQIVAYGCGEKWPEMWAAPNHPGDDPSPRLVLEATTPYRPQSRGAQRASGYHDA